MESHGVNWNNDRKSDANVSSLELMYTDFDVWILKYMYKIKQRQHENGNTGNIDCSWQHLLVHGVLITKSIEKKYNHDCAYDSVILDLLKKNGFVYDLIKSKL